ncbi:MAG: laccase domain-containing protein [Desulfovibrionales bacterium]|nr:laccase domain-containing protein [Desulfovibrionales bacterium]
MSVDYLDFHFPGLSNVRCVFTTRHGGHSTGDFSQANMSLEVGDALEAVRANRAGLRRELGIRVWQELRQVHEQSVFMDLEEDFFSGATLEGDGLCTCRTSHALVVKTADCQALLLADMAGRHVAALHCGWRGNAGNFPAAGVRKFCAHYGVDPTEVLVVRGPSLGPGKSEFVNFNTEWNPMFRSYFNPLTRSVDLWTLTRNQLMGAGIPARNIYSLDLCTASSSQFFSYRRDKVTGRQLGIIWME